MRLKSSQVVPGLFIIVIILFGLTPVHVNAIQIWADDFTDGNYNDWSITGVNMSSITPTEIDGNFTAENFVLRALGPEWNHAYHESSIANGTWRFDIDAVSSELRHFYVIFMSVDGILTEGAPDGYSLMVATDPYVNEFTGYALLRYNEGIVDIAPLGEYETTSGVRGHHHIDIMRNTTGHFKVYVDGVLRISAVDTMHTRSDYFRFHTPAGSAIDNITVYDSEEEPFPPPETTSGPATTPTGTGEPIPLEWLAIGVGIPVVIIIIVVIWKKK